MPSPQLTRPTHLKQGFSQRFTCDEVRHSPIPRQRGTETSEDDFAKLGLGGSLALTGLLAVVKIAETATGVVLTATGVLPGASPSKERAPAWPGGE